MKRPKSICLRPGEVEILKRHGSVKISRKANPPAKAVFLPGDRWKNDPDEPGSAYLDDFGGRMRIFSTIGVTGDRRYVKETYGIDTDGSRQFVVYFDMTRGPDCSDKISHDEAVKRGTLVNGFDWRPSTNMPEWASRYSVDIESTTLEQVGKEWQWSALLRLVDSRA